MDCSEGQCDREHRTSATLRCPFNQSIDDLRLLIYKDTKYVNRRLKNESMDDDIINSIMHCRVVGLFLILFFLLYRTKFLRKNPRFILPTQAVACVLSFGIALPFAIALFPQMSQVSYFPSYSFNLHLVLSYYYLSR